MIYKNGVTLFSHGSRVLNVVSGTDYGPMASAELRARRHKGKSSAGTIHHGPTAATDPFLAEQVEARAVTALLPIFSMFSFLLGGLWIDGGGMDRLSGTPMALLSMNEWRTVLSASESNILILAMAAIFGLFIASLTAFFFSKLAVQSIARAILDGVKGSMLPVSILVLAWALKGSCDTLHTGQFLAISIGSIVSSLWFPVILFVVAGLTSFATGTSWGTMAILIPTALPLAFALDGSVYGLTTMICLGAVLDGAIFGDHCSPISDTTIMSSIFCSCDHIEHVRTQIPYSLTVAACAVLFGYLPAAMGFPSWAGILSSLCVIIALFTLYI